MQIVIKLSDKIYDTIMDDEMPTNEQMKVIVQRIYEGIPLPKGHGSLKDEKEIYKKFYCRCLAGVAKEVLEETLSIIEADTESEVA